MSYTCNKQGHLLHPFLPCNYSCRTNCHEVHFHYKKIREAASLIILILILKHNPPPYFVWGIHVPLTSTVYMLYRRSIPISVLPLPIN